MGQVWVLIMEHFKFTPLWDVTLLCSCFDGSLIGRFFLSIWPITFDKLLFDLLSVLHNPSVHDFDSTSVLFLFMHVWSSFIAIKCSGTNLAWPVTNKFFVQFLPLGIVCLLVMEVWWEVLLLDWLLQRSFSQQSIQPVVFHKDIIRSDQNSLLLELHSWQKV